MLFSFVIVFGVLFVLSLLLDCDYILFADCCADCFRVCVCCRFVALLSYVLDLIVFVFVVLFCCFLGMCVGGLFGLVWFS